MHVYCEFRGHTLKISAWIQQIPCHLNTFQSEYWVRTSPLRPVLDSLFPLIAWICPWPYPRAFAGPLPLSTAHQQWNHQPLVFPSIPASHSHPPIQTPSAQFVYSSEIECWQRMACLAGIIAVMIGFCWERVQACDVMRTLFLIRAKLTHRRDSSTRSRNLSGDQINSLCALWSAMSKGMSKGFHGPFFFCYTCRSKALHVKNDASQVVDDSAFEPWQSSDTIAL